MPWAQGFTGFLYCPISAEVLEYEKAKRSDFSFIFGGTIGIGYVL